MDATELLDVVAREFEETGAATRRWPDPHEGMDGPRDEESSRCLDPAKYRIVPARAEAWTRALERSGLATREPVDDPVAVWAAADAVDDLRRPPAEHGWWLRPNVDGALPLLLTLRSVDASDNHLDLGVGEPAERIDSQPDCGCDACDYGSDGMLEVIDERLLDVVSGRFVHLRIDGTTVISYGTGWSASGPVWARTVDRDEIERAIADVRAGRWAGPALHARAWW